MIGSEEVGDTVDGWVLNAVLVGDLARDRGIFYR
jgi:hypothetical protein